MGATEEDKSVTSKDALGKAESSGITGETSSPSDNEPPKIAHNGKSGIDTWEPQLKENTFEKQTTNKSNDPEKPKNVTIPVLPNEAQNEGGEWELLLGKIKSWFKEANIQNSTQKLLQPLLITAGVIGTILFFSIYGKILNTVALFPLAPRLFELVGTIWILTFSSKRLIKVQDRQKLLTELTKNWAEFLGTNRNKG